MGGRFTFSGNLGHVTLPFKQVLELNNSEMRNGAIYED